MLKIAFAKITTKEQYCELAYEGLILKGNLKRKSDNIVLFKANLNGILAHKCDSCGDDININVNENLELILSDGAFKDELGELSDAVEFFDGFIDLSELANSEIQSFKSDYFYCDNCKNNKGE